MADRGVVPRTSGLAAGALGAPLSGTDLASFTGHLAALHDVARRAGVSAVVLRTQASLSWLLGVRSHVPLTLDRTWFDVVVSWHGRAANLTVLTNCIEAPRLKDTELAGLDDLVAAAGGGSLDWQVVDWWCSREELLPTGTDVGTDAPYPGAVDLSAQVARARRVLSAREQADLALVCRQSAQVATSLVGRMTPASTELEVAGLIARGLVSAGMDVVTLLVAGQDTAVPGAAGGRIARHRHALPLDRPIGSQVTVVFCGRRRGLISAVTRTFCLGRVPTLLADAYDRLLEVEADFLDATVPGSTIGQACAAGVAGYAAHGFDPDEWHRHHQGGFSGWQSREFPAAPGCPDLLEDGAVVAWNPSGEGAKVEDTAVVDPKGPRLLVDDGVWPTVTVRGRRRPQVMEL